MFTIPSPISKITSQLFTGAGLEVFVKRDELVHPIVSGNKWRKLKYFFTGDLPQHIVSFGGAYSNHIHALSFVAANYQIPLSIYVRGEQAWLDRPERLSPTIADCLHNKAQLHFVDRATYRRKDDADFKKELLQAYPEQTLFIPEGGCAQVALTGVAEILSEQQHEFDYILCPVGSATTLAGLIKASDNKQTIVGIAALKQANYLRQRVMELVGPSIKNKNWHLLTEFHAGGFGKVPKQILQLVVEVYQQHGITLDPIYTSKMWLGFNQLITQNYFRAGSKVLLLHTGGLQGWRGLLQQNKVTSDYLTKIGLPQGD
ncbi:1-aminocyclopropane-1-carboxylate deaminase/D-cysteine desulfhydrase [Catenovulum agarivorans]|uniref:1-aminocyclopropane-1-carboxylate deaminase/D-cysteine desulfhydrase n=1 Tax=Catenovulum agarivorans TaxID=1172192 RepID=UPI0002DD213E|nr:pyridoxal-phosphate dependent enzyme [Catenovulum agarivorans]